jgi:filamentous hemagglutinin
VQLPGADKAVVEPRKLRDYLLSPTYPVGRFKEKFFSRLGYTREGWAALGEDLRHHASDGEVIEEVASIYGRKYVVKGEMIGPSGERAEVASVWIILEDEKFPRFVTAYRGRKN